jgi:hypothetical protein
VAGEGDHPLAGIASFLFEMGHPKRVPRSGWVLLGLPQPETIAEHSFREGVVGMALAAIEGADVGRSAARCHFAPGRTCTSVNSCVTVPERVGGGSVMVARGAGPVGSCGPADAGPAATALATAPLGRRAGRILSRCRPGRRPSPAARPGRQARRTGPP